MDLSVENPFAQCWAADYWSVDAAYDPNIHRMVACFNSPAPPSYFALTKTFEQSHPSKRLEILQIVTTMLKKGLHW